MLSLDSVRSYTNLKKGQTLACKKTCSCTLILYLLVDLIVNEYKCLYRNKCLFCHYMGEKCVLTKLIQDMSFSSNLRL